MLALTKYYYYFFGIFTIIGGLIGLSKGSVKSIATAGPAGALLIFAGVLIATKVQPALILGMLISLALGGWFIRIYLETHKVMPAGVMSALSIIGVVLTLITIITAGRR